MSNYLVLTIISDDRAGIVEQVAQTISNHGGNWMESSMARLAGKFAGILMVEVDGAAQHLLEADLAALSTQGIKITVENSGPQTDDEAHISCLEIVANDRSGIVGEISSLLANHKVSLVSLETFCESAPMSAGMMFYAHAYTQLPPGMSEEQLTKLLESLSDDLMVEVIEA
jgi:glycine cleavage system regulatory protein|tara:strand:+ start:12142 stop:12654 length:513 start_codon:yes stop_codon:yes gene_type:complete